MTDPVLSIRNLSKAFGALVVTDDLSLDIMPGECHAIIGPNGAGKTTLIGQLSGELTPDGGHVLFKGADITDTAAHERPHLGLARSFQITNVLPGFSVLENVALAVQIHRGGNSRMIGRAAVETELNEAAMEALIRVGLAERAGTIASTLAHGEKRALELAMALALAPSVLLLDEPMAGTGHEETARMVALLKDLAGERTLVLVEHDMQAVFALADRITVLVGGRAIATDTPDAIRANADVRAAYLGEDAA